MIAPLSKYVFENSPKDSSKVFSQKETTSGNSISQDLKGPKFIAAAIAVTNSKNELFHIQIPKISREISKNSKNLGKY